MGLRGNQNAAFTFVEFSAILAVLALLVAVVLPAITSHCSYPRRMACMSNLKQVSMAEIMFTSDHSDRFACNVSTNYGGGAEFIATGDVGGFYGSLFDYTRNTRSYICPSDNRVAALNGHVLWNSNVSYFATKTEISTNYGEVLAGDRNLIWNGRVLVHGISSLRRTDTLTFTSALHTNVGCVATADGRVAVLTNVVTSLPIACELPQEIVLPFVAE